MKKIVIFVLLFCFFHLSVTDNRAKCANCVWNKGLYVEFYSGEVVCMRTKIPTKEGNLMNANMVDYSHKVVIKWQICA
jgi:hypothetical protein